MDDRQTVEHSPEAAAFQGGDRVPSITPQGQAMNQSISEPDRVKAVSKAPGTTGQEWLSDAPHAGPSQEGGYGVTPPASTPDNRVHQGGEPALDGDAQYGASPLRTARYDENHEANADIANGKTKSGHHGAQARYRRPGDVVNGPTGHDEQQQSRDLAKNGR
ncbi:hypothetical protein [Asticcacaulis taihuensis]|uniref:hypothetical protein n=1 Tax=Asticcacaulis taihuensis TaxID=260084 RepID=UPI0026F1842F|nr:hypothetical protein [Asticcacaulis taihuensis]